ncbi:hypothetical protein ACHMW6_21755 [Pseudoduganella sp. UC29_106]|uniref:hypothetical protein n=1 Tax=Pseudoduganella sp. UC29_106 TaxID=3374553 RepID=UPI0037572CC3
MYYEGLYSRRDFNQLMSALGANLNVPSSSPYFVRPAGAAPASSETVAYRFVFDDTDRNMGGRENNSLNTVGLTYDLDGGWAINSSLTHAKSDAFVHRVGLINSVSLAGALASGRLNPFSATAGSNPGFASLAAHRDQTGTNTDSSFAIKLDGPIYRISGGDVRLAVGAEIRHVGFEQSLTRECNHADANARLFGSREQQECKVDLLRTVCSARRKHERTSIHQAAGAFPGRAL